MFKGPEPALPEEGDSWLRKFEQLKYIFAYFIINCDVLVPIFNPITSNCISNLHETAKYIQIDLTPEFLEP
jgi:hypothetical protein